MAQFARSEVLLRVSKAEKQLIANWSEGVSLQSRSGRKLEELRHRATADRFQLALDSRRRGDRLLAATPPLYRDALSRHYYAMYHAMRAVVFFVEGGDDHEKHAELPSRVPPDFTDADIWQNSLKNARTVRNAADYDPYPKAASAWRLDAESLRNDARRLLSLCHKYLRTKGCRYL
jgi:uncharacterized protein (UPF0332 family)